jgi:hypothetical protein
MVVGVAIFLGFLLLASQTLIHLYATSVATGAAFDAARRAAAEGGGGCPSARPQALAALGAYGERADVEVSCLEVGGQLQVTVSGPTPANLLAGFGRVVGRDGIERTAVVRTERFHGQEGGG